MENVTSLCHDQKNSLWYAGRAIENKTKNLFALSNSGYKNNSQKYW